MDGRDDHFMATRHMFSVKDHRRGYTLADRQTKHYLSRC